MRAVLIHNLLSGQRRRQKEIAAAVARLVSAGWEVELLVSSDAREMERHARAAVDLGLDLLVAAGGDGTVNLAVQALANKRTALGVIPTGTTNVWAREMGIPLAVDAATEMLLRGEMAEVDLGLANGRYFLFVAGVGFDAEVTRVLDSKAKRRLGWIAYAAAAASEALKMRGEETTIVVDGTVLRRRLLMLVATHLRLYGGVVKIAPGAFADDGLLDVWLFRGHGVPATIRHAASVLLGRHTRDPEAEYYRCSALSVDAARPLSVQLDGDYFGTTPVSIRVLPRALKVLVPPGPHPLLQHQVEATAV